MRESHGHYNTPEYKAWEHMKYRCSNKNSEEYKNYGQRGIEVCDRWKNSFSNFLEDMGYRPSELHSLDRIDVNKGYEPRNCKWSTVKEQNRNKQNTKYIEFQNEIKPLVEWAEKFNLTRKTVSNRLVRGWSIEKTLLTPQLTKGGKVKYV